MWQINRSESSNQGHSNGVITSSHAVWKVDKIVFRFQQNFLYCSHHFSYLQTTTPPFSIETKLQATLVGQAPPLSLKDTLLFYLNLMEWNSYISLPFLLKSSLPFLLELVRLCEVLSEEILLGHQTQVTFYLVKKLILQASYCKDLIDTSFSCWWSALSTFLPLTKFYFFIFEFKPMPFWIQNLYWPSLTYQEDNRRSTPLR